MYGSMRCGNHNTFNFLSSSLLIVFTPEIMIINNTDISIGSCVRDPSYTETLVAMRCKCLTMLQYVRDPSHTGLKRNQCCC